MYDETPEPEFNCKRCPVMTILDAEFDDEFIEWMYFLAEQRQRRESGFQFDEMTRLDEKAIMTIDRWAAKEREKEVKNLKKRAGRR